MKSKEFLKSLAEYAAQLRQTIEAEADGFDASPAAIAERRAKVLDPVNGYEYFVNTYFPHYVRSSEKSELHEFLFSRLPEILQQPEGINEADAAPRGEAKSTLVTRLFSLWTVITGAKKFIVIAMDSIDQAYPMLEPDGFLTIKHISNKSGELAKYVPYRDGSLVYRGSGGEETCNTDVLYLFITHRATSTNPAGEMAAARLYAPVALRKKGFVYAAQFITRYAQPYLIAKIQANSEDDHNGFMSRFYRFVSGGALSIEREDDVMMLQNSADGQAFRRLENLANARIQKTLLGKVKTSDLETASRASQETEENNRDERIGAYLALLSRAAQHFIDALVMVNNAYGKPINAPKGVWFEFEDEIKVDKTRAERDKMYMDTGQLVLTETYYRDILGFEPEHFELRDPKALSENPAPAKFSLRLSDGLARNAPDTAEQAIARPKMEAVLGLLESCKDYAEFEAKLSKLDLSKGDNLLIQRLVSEGLSAWADGAGDGRD